MLPPNTRYCFVLRVGEEYLTVVDQHRTDAARAKGNTPLQPLRTFGMEDDGDYGHPGRSPSRGAGPGSVRTIPTADSMGAPPPPSTPIPLQNRHSSLEARNKRALPAVPAGHSEEPGSSGVPTAAAMGAPAPPTAAIRTPTPAARSPGLSNDAQDVGAMYPTMPTRPTRLLPGTQDAKPFERAGTQLDFV